MVLKPEAKHLKIDLLGPLFTRVDKSSFKKDSRTNQAGKKTLRPDQLPRRTETSQAA